MLERSTITYKKILFVGLGTVVLVGVLTYLHIAFEGADVKTAIRLVEESKERPAW